MAQNIIVVVPGTTGSTLYSGTTEVWTTEVLQNPDQMTTLLEQPLTVGSIGMKTYSPLINAIAAKAGGVTPIYVTSETQYNSATFPATTKDVVVGFGYDWRIDNTQSAAALATLLSQLYTAYGANAPKFWIVAHSMGGLISRYVWEGGLASGTNFKGMKPNLITLGTPHLGAPLALAAITNEMPSLLLTLLGVPGSQIQSFVDDPDYPSTYELLPPPSYKFVADVNNKGTVYSVFDQLIQTAVVSGYKGNQGCLNAASAFFSKLGNPASVWSDNLYLVSGTNLDTTVAYSYDGKQPTSSQLSRPGVPNLGGDEVVPIWSSSFSTWSPTSTKQRATAPGVSHTKLPTDSGVQNKVIAWIYPQ